MMGKPWRRWSLVACIGLAVTACATLQAYEFDRAVDQLSQTEVLARGGRPDDVVAGTAGQTLWIYTFRYQTIVSPGSLVVISPGWLVSGGDRCTQYLLLFDAAQVLRAWRARPC
jgi:hypothetical protein